MGLQHSPSRVKAAAAAANSHGAAAASAGEDTHGLGERRSGPSERRGRGSKWTERRGPGSPVLQNMVVEALDVLMVKLPSDSGLLGTGFSNSSLASWIPMSIASKTLRFEANKFSCAAILPLMQQSQ